MGAYFRNVAYGLAFLLGFHALAQENPEIGQATMSLSRPVVIASDQSAVFVKQSGTWTFGRTWNLLNTTDSVNAVQSGTWTTGRTWSLASGSDSVTSVQSGTWAMNLTQLNGASPSATNYLPSRLTNGTSYVDPTQIRALSSGTDSVAITAASLPLPAGAATSALQSTMNSTLSNIDGKTPALGQATMANSSPVVLASNQTGINSFLDKGTSGSINALNGTVSVATNGMSVLTLSVSGTWVGTLQFEASNDNGSTYPFVITGVTVPAGINGTTTSSNSQWLISAAGYDHVRVRASAYTSGTANLLMNTGAGSVGNLATTVASIPIGGANRFRNITGAATTVVKSGPGILHTFCVANGLVGTYVLYDNTAASGTIIITVTNFAGQTFNCGIFDVAFTNGLTITTTGANSNVTVTYQ